MTGAANGADPGDQRGGADRRRPLRIRSPHDETFLEGLGDFVRRVWNKGDQDQIFFMAGAIAFNILVAIIPLLLASLGIAGLFLRRQAANPEDVLLGYILNAIPEVSAEFEQGIRTRLVALLNNSSRNTVVGLVLLVWVSTRLIGTLRAALKEVFDVGQDRNIIQGKIFDIKIVLIAGTLFSVNVVLTVALNLVDGLLTQAGKQYFGVTPLDWVHGFYLNAIAVITSWVMFLLIYRYLPYRRVHWKTALYAATFTTTLFELLKRLFTWYVVNWANYSTTYGNVTVAIILFLWVYYMSVIFILGGEVGQVASLRRIRKRQKQRLG